MPLPDILTPLRDLTGPGALEAECFVCSHLQEKLVTAGERLWPELTKALGRMRKAESVEEILKAQLAVEEKLAGARANLDEREALLDRHEALLDMREGK